MFQGVVYSILGVVCPNCQWDPDATCYCMWQDVERDGNINRVTFDDHSWLMCMSEQFYMLVKSIVPS